MHISEIQVRLMEIVGNNPFGQARGFMKKHGANKNDLADAYHAALWIEGAPAEVKSDFLGLFNEDDCPEMRICSACGNFMFKGYLIDDGQAYYCSRECAVQGYIRGVRDGGVKKHRISRERAENILDRDLEEAEDCFWTEW